VSSISGWIGRPSSPPLAFCTLAHISPPRFSCCPTEPSGPVNANGMPILIGSAAATRRTHGIARAVPVSAKVAI